MIALAIAAIIAAVAIPGYRDHMLRARIPDATSTLSELAAGARTIKVGERTMSLITDDAGRISVINSPAPGSSTPTARRVSWQELDEQ